MPNKQSDREAIATLQTSNHELYQRVRTLEERCDRLTTKMTTLQLEPSEKAAIQQRFDSFDRQLDALDRRVEARVIALNAWQGGLDEWVASTEEYVAGLPAVFACLWADVHEHATRIEKLETSARHDDGTFGVHARRIEQVERTQREELSAAYLVINDSRRRLDELESDSRLAEASAGALHRRINDLEERLSSPPVDEVQEGPEGAMPAETPRWHLLDALARIAAGGCENYATVSGRRCWDDLARSVFYVHGADRWCNPCIALAGLQGRELT